MWMIILIVSGTASVTYLFYRCVEDVVDNWPRHPSKAVTYAVEYA